MRSVSESLQHKTPTSTELVGLEQPKMHFVIFLLHSFLRWQWETKMKLSWLAMPTYNAVRAKHDAHIALATAGYGGAFGVSPFKSMQYTSNGTMPHALSNRQIKMLIAREFTAITVNAMCNNQ